MTDAVAGKLLIFFLCIVPAAVLADTAPAPPDLARCAAIAASDARLACYDALSRGSPAAPVATSPRGAQAAPPHSPAPAVVPAAPAAVAPPAAPAALAPAVAAATEDPGQFGLSAAQRHVEVAGPKQERGQIMSVSPGTPGHATVVLDNGQTWAVLDADAWLSNGEKIIIKRAALGSFLMRTPSNHLYRVHRLQ